MHNMMGGVTPPFLKFSCHSRTGFPVPGKAIIPNVPPYLKNDGYDGHLPGIVVVS